MKLSPFKVILLRHLRIEWLSMLEVIILLWISHSMIFLSFISPIGHSSSKIFISQFFSRSIWIQKGRENLHINISE